MSVECYRESPRKFDSRTLNRKTLNRWTGRTHHAAAELWLAHCAYAMLIIVIITIMVYYCYYCYCYYH